MGFSVGEMFVQLGVRGSEKTISAIEQSRKGILGLKDMSFEAKAAIVGLFYALERAFSATGQQGVSLTNTGMILDMNKQKLQQYEYALRQVGGTADEMDQTFISLRDSISNMIFGKGAPERLLAVMSQLRAAGIDVKNQEQLEWAKHPEQLIQRLQQYAQMKNIPAFEKGPFLKSFGLSNTMIAALEKGVFNPAVFAKASVYTDDIIKKLNDSAIAWSNVGASFKKAFGEITAEFGKPLADDFQKLVGPTKDLARAIVMLSEKLHLLEGVSKAFEGWAKLLDITTGKMPAPATGGVIDKFNPKTGGFMPWDLMDIIRDLKNAFKMQERLDERAQRQNTQAPVTFNQTFPGKVDHEMVKGAAKDGVEAAHRQRSANVGGT
jgi:hypothetical protein